MSGNGTATQTSNRNSRFTMNGRERIRVADWIRDHWQQIEAEAPTQNEIAERINRELGLQLSGLLRHTHVAGVVDDLDFKWPSPKAISQLRDEVARKEVLFEDLRATLVLLCQKVGVPVPPSLNNPA